ncbi:MAG: branched-chain amino acid ABC transporter permease [Hyphomicrobiaceae bacterium]|nr:branched-chain amino acid ABC transporter permease [Hyphomicrobiaceae bacterium]
MSSLTQIDEAQASRVRYTIWFGLIGIVVVWFGLMPTLGGNLSLYFSLMLWVTMATAFNIIAGFTGYMPFGYVAFYGMGTYATAMLVVNYNVSPYLAIPLAGLAGMMLALVFAPTLRLGGIYFAIVSLSLAVIMQRIMGLAPDELTGGSHGLNLGAKTNRQDGYYAMLLVLVMALTTVTWLARSRLGKALKAIRDDAEAADAMGVNVQRSRLYAWLMSAGFASLCGGVQAWFTGALDPITAFDVLVTAKTVIYAMAGGLGTVTGPVVGTVILVWVDELIWREFPILNNFLLGLIIALLILFMPRGIVGTIMQRFPRTRRLIM